MNNLNKLEQVVIEKVLLNHFGQNTSKLFVQSVNQILVTERLFTGVGFFTHVNDQTNILKNIDDKHFLSEKKFRLNIEGTCKDTKIGPGFIVFCEDNKIVCIEGFTYDEPWPKGPSEYNIKGSIVNL